MSSQPVAGAGFFGYNSYPMAMGTYSLLNGYPSGYGYPGLDSASGFAFRKRMERIDWKKLASVDVDLVARNLDFQILQDNIANIAFCSIESEMDPHSFDPNYVKLFKLSQLMIEYLLHSQDYLWIRMQDVQQELEKERSEHETTKKEMVDKMKTEIAELKKELHQRKKIISVQQQILHSGHDAVNRCQFCSKAFVNQSFLQAHLSRRHPEFAASVNQPVEVIKATPILSSAPPPVNNEVENELLQIRERLRQTESWLVEERNARNADTKKEVKVKEQIEEEMTEKFDSWKQAQLKSQKNEIEKLQNMFMKELKEMSGKLRSAEDNLDELKHMRARGSMLGSLKDDVDPEEQQRQRKQMKDDLRKEMLNQVGDVETRMRKEMVEQERAWKKKMRDMKNNDDQKLRKMNEEMERMKTEEGRRHLKDLEEKQRLKDEAMQRKIENRKSDAITDQQIPNLQLQKQKSNVAPALQSAVQTRVEKDTEEDDEEEEDDDDEDLESDEDEGKNEDYNQVRKAQAEHLRTLEDDDSEAFPMKRRALSDPDLIRACRNDDLQRLEIALEDLGIPKAATGISSETYQRNTDTLERERGRKHKKKNDQFYAIRREKASEVNQRALEILKQQPKSILQMDFDSGKSKMPHSGRSTQRSYNRAASLPPQQVKRTPKPSPRTGTTLPSKMTSTNPSMMMTTQSFTSTGTLSVTGASVNPPNGFDSTDHGPVAQKRTVTLAKTPAGPNPSSNRPVSSSQLQRQAAAEQDSDDVSSDWDETSRLEPTPRSRTPRQLNSNKKPTGNTVAQRKLEIEQQLMARDVKKPAGGVDVTPLQTAKPNLSTKKTTFDDDLEALSLTSVSAADDVKPTPKPRQPNARSSVQSSVPTVSNSYGTSKWGSSVSVGDSVSSFDEKNLESKDSWNDDDDDE